MSESLFLINPRRRKRRKNAMPAGLRRYWAGKRRRRKVNVRHRRRRNPLAALANPRRRRRRHNVRHHKRHRHHYRHRRRNARFHRRRHRRSNPFGGATVKDLIMPAAVGAGGAIVLAVAYNYVAPNLPSQFQSGFFPAILQGAAAIGLGMIAGKFLGRAQGHAVALGGLTVVLVNSITPALSSATGGAIPGLSGLGGLKLGMGDYIPYSRPMGAYMRNPNMGRLGFVSPAPRLGAYMSRPVPGMKGFGGTTIGMPAQHDMAGGSGYTGLPDNM